MEKIKKIPVILDGDPGHDDAIAWVVAKASPMLDIRAVTTVCGNQTLEKTTYNAQRICTLIGLDAPIAKGRPRPLFTDPMVAPNVHGQTGLDGPVLPEPKMEVQPLSAVELMAKILRESDEKITLIPTGPLTTIASLLLTHPELKDKIAHIYMM
ncbi:MAG: nucleoside hydrolase, partial [Clostridia bacterium]|nr:nucleoside hydrolase [Clostridia bacterium]